MAIHYQKKKEKNPKQVELDDKIKKMYFWKS